VNQKELRRYLSVIKRAVSLIEGMLDNDDGGLLEEMISEPEVPRALPAAEYQQPAAPPAKPAPSVAHQTARKKHLQDLLDIDCWPEAVPQHLMCGPTKEDQVKRAKAVLDMMLDRGLSGARLLDFGCGEGWIANEALKRGCALATGYDNTPNDNWEEFDGGAQFTSVYNEVPKHQYDIVFLYDVLDHAFEPEEVMQQVRECVKDDGVVYVRCHPWTSRHATHLWKKGINKAYLHLFFTWEEMKTLLGEPPTFTRPEKYPITAYHNWFKKDFNIIKECPLEEPVSEFFYVPAFKDLLANEQGIAKQDIDNFIDSMKLQFVDFVLSPK